MGSKVTTIIDDSISESELMESTKQYYTRSRRKSRNSILDCCINLSSNSTTSPSVDLTPEYQCKNSKRSRKCLYQSPEDNNNKENINPHFGSIRKTKIHPSTLLSQKTRCRKTADKGSYLSSFFKIFDDDVIQDFLWMDSCYRLSDKYLLAMVYTYFRRARLNRREYNRANFFAALYLSHDMEEDDEDLKLEIYPWVLGDQWRSKHLDFIHQRDKLLKRMDYRAVVSQLTCNEVIDLCPSHPIWKRERKPHHGGAIRVYPDEENSDFSPRGPHSGPLYCSLCAEFDQRTSSPAYTSGYLSACSSVVFSPTVTSLKQNEFEDVKAMMIVDEDEDDILLCREE